MTDFTFFWQNRSPFSNWYPSKFTHNGINFTRGEQYMMYQKAMLFGDTTVAQAILLTDNPKEQKDLGRLVANYDDAIWSEKRLDIVAEGLFEKFNQNENLKQALLATGDTEIVEASPYDCVWGIGFREEDPQARDKSKWRGQNLLGIALMRVRDKILDDDNFKKNLEIGIAGEDSVYQYLINNNGLVEDSRSQVHGEGAGPRMVGTEGKLIQPDFCVFNKPGSPKGRFAVDVKVKSSIYPFKGVRCFTVDKKFEDYKRIVEIKHLEYLAIVFIYENEMYFYKDSDCIGLEFKSNDFGHGNVYYFEYDKSKIRR